jgi:hypothetical protein
MRKNKNNFIGNTICSLYEVENFLCKYNNFLDMLYIAKILSKKKHRK